MRLTYTYDKNSKIIWRLESSKNEIIIEGTLKEIADYMAKG